VSQMVEHRAGTAGRHPLDGAGAGGARERKGEFTRAVCRTCRRRALCASGVNGTVYEWPRPAGAEENEKHDLDVVMDRLKVRRTPRGHRATTCQAAPGRELLKRRYAWPMAAPLRWKWTQPDAAGAEHIVLTRKFACPLCSYSIGELEPRLFSFNSPGRRLPQLRRPGRAGSFRSGAGGGLSRA
jgi:excinuclease ABC subunit A